MPRFRSPGAHLRPGMSRQPSTFLCSMAKIEIVVSIQGTLPIVSSSTRTSCISITSKSSTAFPYAILALPMLTKRSTACITLCNYRIFNWLSTVQSSVSNPIPEDVTIPGSEICRDVECSALELTRCIGALKLYRLTNCLPVTA